MQVKLCVAANQISKDMGKLMPRCRTMAEIEYEQRTDNRSEMKEIVIALIQGGWEGTTEELIQRAKEIRDALKNA